MSNVANMDFLNCTIEVTWPNGDSFKSTTAYPNTVELDGNQVLMDAIKSLMESAIDSGYMMGSRGFPVVESN